MEPLVPQPYMLFVRQWEERTEKQPSYTIISIPSTQILATAAKNLIISSCWECWVMGLEPEQQELFSPEFDWEED